MFRVSIEPVHHQIDRWLTADEEERLLPASPDWLREVIIFALNTGMRTIRRKVSGMEWIYWIGGPHPLWYDLVTTVRNRVTPGFMNPKQTCS